MTRVLFGEYSILRPRDDVSKKDSASEVETKLVPTMNAKDQKSRELFKNTVLTFSSCSCRDETSRVMSPKGRPQTMKLSTKTRSL